MTSGFFAAFVIFFGTAMAYLLWDARQVKRGGSKQWNEKMLATRQTARAPDSWKFGEWRHSHEDWSMANIEADGYVLAVSEETFMGNCFHFVLASSPRRAGENVNFTGGKDFYSASLKNVAGRYFRQFHVTTGSPEDDREFLSSRECEILKRACKTGERVKIKTKAGKSLVCQPDSRFHPVKFDSSVTCPIILAPEVEWS